MSNAISKLLKSRKERAEREIQRNLHQIKLKSIMNMKTGEVSGEPEKSIKDCLNSSQYCSTDGRHSDNETQPEVLDCVNTPIGIHD